MRIAQIVPCGAAAAALLAAAPARGQAAAAEEDAKVSLAGPAPVEAGAETGHLKGAKRFSILMPGGGGPFVGFGWFLDDDKAVEIHGALSLTHTDEPSSNTGGFTIAPSLVKYLLHGQVSPYVRGAAVITKVERIDFGDALQVRLGGAFGVEYSFNRRLSLSGEWGAGLAFTNKFKNIALLTGPGTLNLNLYWL